MNDAVAVEEPLEIRLRYRVCGRWTTEAIAVTMRSPGYEDELAAGFLFSESVIASAHDIARIEITGESCNEVTLELREGVDVDWERLKRNFYTTSSCGVCGKASLRALDIDDAAPLALSSPVACSALERIPALLREAQTDFAATGGLHAAGLFTNTGELHAAREDVGRHNATDKLIGHYLLAGEVDLGNSILALSGRASFELLQKAWRARIPVVAAVGAPSSLAIDLANRFGITLIGFLRESRFNIYANSQRIHSLTGAAR